MNMKDDDYMTTFVEEHCDDDTIALIKEMIPYELICRLLKENLRLGDLLMNTREEVNSLASLAENGKNPVYPLTAENVFGGIGDDHPAMERYFELYEDHAAVQR
jgi:hypothetical protein